MQRLDTMRDMAEDVEHETRLARATQGVRVQQSKRTLPLVGAGAVAFAVTYWGEAPTTGIVTWVALVMLSTCVRWAVVRPVSRRLDEADLLELRRFERWLFATSMLNGLAVGSGFWWVAMGGSQVAAYAVTLLCSIYSIGAMINASVQYRSFAPTVIVNLGQGVAFSLGIGTWEPLIAVALVIIMLLQLGFGRANASQFAESIRMRSENMRLVEQLTAEKLAVEQALAAAREANESKSHFLAAASHDLRQPLHAISLYLGSLALQLTDRSDRELLDRIIEATDVLRNQFDGLLDLSQFDAQGIHAEITHFRLDLLLDRLCNESNGDAQAKNLSLTLTADPCVVESDALQLERLLRNLIENAIRYTLDGGVTVTARRSGHKVRVAIEDTGPGIAEADRSRVFQDFVQLDNRARQRDKGVGLGLAIVRRINELLDLKLQLESREDMGTRFVFELPFVATASRRTRTPVRAEQHVAGAANGLSVWAIDDDAVVREALKAQLEAWGCQVTVASCWGELQNAVEQLGAWPDLAIVDDMLGTDETGLDIARKLADRIEPKRIALITGNTQPMRLKALRDSGFPVLLKPTKTNQLWHLVQSCCPGDTRAGTV